jgi:hypothetical protein
VGFFAGGSVGKKVKMEGDNFDESKGKNQRYTFYLFPCP